MANNPVTYESADVGFGDETASIYRAGYLTAASDTATYRGSIRRLGYMETTRLAARANRNIARRSKNVDVASFASFASLHQRIGSKKIMFEESSSLPFRQIANLSVLLPANLH